MAGRIRKIETDSESLRDGVTKDVLPDGHAVIPT